MEMNEKRKKIINKKKKNLKTSTRKLSAFWVLFIKVCKFVIFSYFQNWWFCCKINFLFVPEIKMENHF